VGRKVAWEKGLTAAAVKRQVPFSAPWEQLHCNVQAVRNLQSTVPVSFFFRLP